MKYNDSTIPFYPEIDDYLASAAHLYGILPVEHFIYLMQKYNKTLEKTALNSPKFSAENREYSFYIDNNHIITRLCGKSVIANVRRISLDIPYYEPSKVELLRYRDRNYYPHSKESDMLLDFIHRRNSVSDDALQEMLCLLAIHFAARTPRNEWINVLQSYGISLNLPSDVGIFLRLSGQMCNNIRLWSNHGHTPNEVLALRALS